MTWAEHALTRLRDAGYRQGGARRAVVELLGAQPCAVSARTILDTLRPLSRSVSRIVRALTAHGCAPRSSTTARRAPPCR